MPAVLGHGPRVFLVFSNGFLVFWLVPERGTEMWKTPGRGKPNSKNDLHSWVNTIETSMIVYLRVSGV